MSFKIVVANYGESGDLLCRGGNALLVGLGTGVDVPHSHATLMTRGIELQNHNNNNNNKMSYDILSVSNEHLCPDFIFAVFKKSPLAVKRPLPRSFRGQGEVLINSVIECPCILYYFRVTIQIMYYFTSRNTSVKRVEFLYKL